MQRLRKVRSLARQAREMDREALSRLLELFASEWSKRRALNALLEVQVPANLPDALALIVRVEREVHERFGVRLTREFELW